MNDMVESGREGVKPSPSKILSSAGDSFGRPNEMRSADARLAGIGRSDDMRGDTGDGAVFADRVADEDAEGDDSFVPK